MLTNSKGMNCLEFRDILISYPIFCDTITEKESNEIFNYSIMTQIDEVTKDRHT